MMLRCAPRYQVDPTRHLNIKHTGRQVIEQKADFINIKLKSKAQTQIIQNSKGKMHKQKGRWQKTQEAGRETLESQSN